MNKSEDGREQTVAANVAVHSAMAATYNEREPHFRPENQAVVRAVLERIAAATGGGRLLDLGCGTGFVINLAKGLFNEIHGVDITLEMLNRVEKGGHNIVLHHGLCEDLPFENATFDVVTAYSFLDHLADYTTVLAEAHRVMRPGGIFYADLLPNRDFWEAVLRTEGGRGSFPLVERELRMLKEQHLTVQTEYGIDAADFKAAEPWKNATHGIAADEIESAALRIGFAEVTVSYRWYIGQAKILHGRGSESAEMVDELLQEVLPLSRHLFKYLRVEMRR